MYTHMQHNTQTCTCQHNEDHVYRPEIVTRGQLLETRKEEVGTSNRSPEPIICRAAPPRGKSSHDAIPVSEQKHSSG